MSNSKVRQTLATASVFFPTLLCAGLALAADEDNRFLAAAQDRAFIARALEQERQATPPSLPVTGVTVPHHLLAADLIARGILAAAGGTYDRVLIISPDHFRRLKTPFGITTADLKTINGDLAADRPFSQTVLHANSKFADTGNASDEHGIHAVAPFIRAVFPNVHIAAITIAASSTPADWREAAVLLSGMVDAKTLIVQSTDYSHFLPVETAVLRDQETLAVLGSGEPEAVLPLDQPSHMDCKGCQFIQTFLQRTLYNAAPVIVANRNSNEYVPGSGPTTSYVVTVFTPDSEHGGKLRFPDQAVMYFGGDTYIGRGWTEPAMQPSGMDWLVRRINDVTAGHPVVVNLEGVILDQIPAGTNSAQHIMLSSLALPVLKELNLAAANLANNHAYDFGEEGLSESVKLLQAASIPALRHGVVADLGVVKVLPLTFKRGYFFDHAVIRELSQLQSICALQGPSPLIVLAHWGGDYTDTPGPFEREVLDKLATCGVSAVIGAHSHRASPKVELRAGGVLQSVFSMGNLIFDQTGENISGSLVEVRIFRQGTIALRVVRIPNFFEMQKSLMVTPGATK